MFKNNIKYHIIQKNMTQYFFNKVFSCFQNLKIQNKQVLLGVSGGLDSVVLLDILNSLKSPCNLQLFCTYIHHGASQVSSLQNYRDKAQDHVKTLSDKYHCKFISTQASKTILKSEEDFRNFRNMHFKNILKDHNIDILALAHNSNDLLEGRLIQLIRGCGSAGLKSMKIWNSPCLKPLLYFSKKEIQAYALKKNLHWLEDPSNKDSHYLRNWIRNTWLVDLENKRSGATKTLARSLEALTCLETQTINLKAISSQGIDRKLLDQMSTQEQKKILASYMQALCITNYGLTHIEELLKHSKRAKKQFIVSILKKDWSFSQNFICAK